MADYESEEHSHHAEVGPGVHLPDPSVWPLIVGISLLLVGGALVWWVNDRDSAFTGPLLGASIVAALVAVGGWAYEDGKMKRKAEEEQHGGPRLARFTQVITFAIADGQFENASSQAGVLKRIEASDSDLRNLSGFQDLRIIASPAETGPSQVLVETTWSDREGLATYDETRQTVLDIVNEFPEQVVPGSVQVFDMVVVRDTKDVAVRFGLGTAATLIGGLAIGGFLIGAGLTLFEGERVAVPGNDVAPPDDGFAETGVIEGGNFWFDPTEISLPPATEVTLTFVNTEGPHNIEIFPSPEMGFDLPRLDTCIEGCQDGGTQVITEMTQGPAESTFTFVTPDEPGEYGFWCVFHTDQMRGTLTVEEGAPVPGETAPPDDAENGDDEAEDEENGMGGA